MTTFTYLARTQDGLRKEGQLDAANRNEAVNLLSKDNLIVIKLTHKDISFDFIEPFINRFNLAMNKFKNRIPLNTLVFFTRQLATMFSAGLTIEKSLHFLAMEEKHKNFIKILQNVMENCSGVRRFGAAALDLAYVASGRYDAFWEFGLKIWDIAAGSLLVKEAGGFIQDINEKENFLYTGNIFACNNSLNEEFKTRIIQISENAI